MVADGFLGRWSQRKQAVREGAPLPEPALPAAAQNQLASLEPTPAQEPSTPEAATEPAPALTLEDAQKLSPESDFSPFVARGVAPEVRNAAMKRLFADPQFNVMDRLDIYIDDYSQPDPLPLSVLRQMASAQFLKLVESPETPAEPTTELPVDPATDPHNNP